MCVCRSPEFNGAPVNISMQPKWAEENKRGAGDIGGDVTAKAKTGGAPSEISLSRLDYASRDSLQKFGNERGTEDNLKQQPRGPAGAAAATSRTWWL